MNLSRNSAIALGLVLLVTVASIPLWANQGWVFIAGVILIESLFCLSWNLLFGFAGLATFGHAAFFAAGAYVVGAGLTQYPSVPFPALLVGSLLLGAVAALAVGFVALRRTGGMQLAILTLAMSEVLYIFINNAHSLGGADGLAGIPRPFIGPISLKSGPAYFWFLLVVCGGVSMAMWWLIHSRFGRILRCIKQDAERAQFIGVDIHRYRLAAFVVSGAVAALAGGLSAPWTQIVAPGVGSWVHSVQAILNSLMGGAGFFWGPALGTVIFAGIDYLTRTFAGVSEVVVGGILLIVVLAFPGGILGVLSNLKWRGSKARNEAVSREAAKEPAE